MSWTDKPAEGYGASATGGAGGTTIYVTNLNNDGAGSFRRAVEGVDGSGTRGARIVKFQVSGTITLTAAVIARNGEEHGQSVPSANYDNLTIDGSDAPAHGIQIAGETVSIQCDNVIIKHMRFRSDEQGTVSVDSLSLGGNTGCNDVLINHCSIQVGDDEDIDVNANCNNVTIQYCMFGPNLGPGSMLAGYGGSSTVSIHHNLLFNNDRNPESPGAIDCDFVNNVIYRNIDQGFGFEAVSRWPPDFGNINANIIGNYFKMGTYLTSQYNSNDRPIYFYTGRGNNGVFYLATNEIRNNSDTLVTNVQSEIYGGDAPNGTDLTIAGSPFNYPAITTTSASQAYADVLAYAGAHQPCGLDSMDQLILSQVQAGAGETSQSGYVTIDDIGGYPDLTQPCGAVPGVTVTADFTMRVL